MAPNANQARRLRQEFEYGVMLPLGLSLFNSILL